MYITYENRQYRALKLYFDSSKKWHATPPGWTLGPAPESEFKPSFLVRVSDMQKIRGCEADEGYYALSYSWNQSGDIIKDENDEHRRVDDGKHKIVSCGITEKSSSMRRLLKFLTRKSEYVKFERLIQRICQDYGVKYIWYDQICINQLDPADKKRELRQMHRIYGNACCTIALVPDMEVVFYYHEWPKRRLWQLNGIRDKQWAKRLWTLEEAAMSKKVLFIGRNVHLWSHTSMPGCFGVQDDAFVRQICNRSLPWNAHSVLWHARRRTSTKPHDRVFAIANIFPDIVDEIDFNYHQPLIDLMIQFYCLLVKKDLTVLCFGSPIGWISDSIIPVPEDDLLPSWTGSKGIHVKPSNLKTAFLDYSIIGTSLHIKCSYTPASIEPLVKYNRKGPKFPIFYTFADTESSSPQGNTTKRLGFGISKPPVFVVHDSPKKKFPYGDYLLHEGVGGSYYFPMKQETDTTWINSPMSPSDYCGYLSLTEECTNCVILSGVRFFQGGSDSPTGVYPVIRQDGGYYKSIGVCVMPDIFECIKEPEQTFIIK